MSDTEETIPTSSQTQMSSSDTQVNDDNPELDDHGQSQSKTKKRWKLKNADMRILDVFKKTKAGGAVMLVVKMEFTFKNSSMQNKTKVAGENYLLIVRSIQITK